MIVLLISKNLINNNVRRSKLTRGKGKSANKGVVNKMQVMQMIHASQKQVTSKYLSNVYYAQNTVPVTGNLTQIAWPLQGVLNGQREGDSLSLEKIEVRYAMSNPEASIGATNVDMIRIVCVQAIANTALSLSNSTTPSTGIFDNGASGSVDVTSHINYDAKDTLFRVLIDEIHGVNFLSSNAARLVNLELNPKIKKINFTPTTNTSQTGAIYFVLMSYTGDCIVSGEGRLIYHDL
jgi:hypothetical protein